MSSTHTVHLGDLGKLMQIHEEARQAHLLDALELAAHRAKTVAVKETPVDQGDARKTWTVKRGADYVELRSDLPYVEVLELGRRPGQTPPPIEPILEWVIRHEAELGPFGEERDVGGTTRTPEPLTLKDGTELDAWDADVRDIALRIRAKIGAAGTEPHLMIGGNLELFGEFLQEELRAALEEAP